MNKTSVRNRSAASWLLELAEGRYGEYALSVLAALLGVACSLIPYFIIIRIITALVNGTAELSRCLTLCAWMAGWWWEHDHDTQSCHPGHRQLRAGTGRHQR